MTSTTPAPSKSCHNCRRRRLRCDRSYPTCLKCAANGQQCLGYGELLRWTHAVASRGKMAGRATFENIGNGTDTGNGQLAVSARGIASSFLDPVLQELGTQGRFYAHHFVTSVCGDLVSFDQPDQNPFRFMIPLMGRHAYLREIVIATSAMHLATHRRSRGQPTGTALVHALSARQQAIRFLRSAITHITDDNRFVILAAVVFFVNFDLVDSGKGTWKTHLDAAGVLINALYGDATSPTGTMFVPDKTMARLLDGVVADCITYHILGSTLTSVDESAASVYDNIDISSVLHRAEAYSYHCCPPKILQILVCMTRLGSRRNQDSSPSEYGESEDRTELAASLLLQARAFDVKRWVDSIPNLSTNDDHEARVQLASAHRASACLYIILALPPGVNLKGKDTYTQNLVEEILHSLSIVPTEHVLVKGSVWPTFMAGAQSDDPAQRQWCMRRLGTMWRSSPLMCPWGYVETALATLKGVWAARDALPLPERKSWNWLRQLRETTDIDCLIV